LVMRSPGRGLKMTTERTELEWSYDPADLFEAPYQRVETDFDLLIDTGRALATLKIPQEPISREMEGKIRGAIENVFLVRQLQTHRKYKIEGPRFYQYFEGRKDTGVRPNTETMKIESERVDFILADSTGKAVRDSKSVLARADRVIK
jgi:hypothetical protein